MRTLITMLIALTFLGCATKRVMKDCEPLSDGFYECEEP